MTHTEKYELPIIEGTDVIDYEPFNEGMGKIEEVLENNENLVQEAVDDVAEMGDTLDQKMQEVNQALEQTETDVNSALEQTTESINESVNTKLGKISEFVLAKRYSVPDETYYFGSQSGNLRVPISSVSPIINRGATLTDNRFTIPAGTQSGIPVSKIDLDITVEPTGGGGEFNGNCNTTLELWRYRQNQDNELIASEVVNTSVKTSIHLSGLATMSGGEYLYFILSSGYTHKLVDTMNLTVENIGMNN